MTAPARRMTVDERQSGTAVSLAAGERLEVSLAETPTTGYRWRVEADGAPACRVVEDRFEAPGPRPGAPGRRLLVLEGTGRGAAELRLACVRAWDAGAPSRTFVLRVAAPADQ